MGLDTVDLAMRIEREFSIDVPDQKWELVSTVQDMYDIVWEFAGSRLVSKAAMIEKINNILVDQIGCEPDEISPEKSLTSDLGLD